MMISERALNFAIKTYEELNHENNNILHSMTVGDILKYHGFDDNVVAAGYLHDLPYNSSYSIDDISKLFCGDIASLLLTFADSKKIDQKSQIKNVQNLQVRNKAVIVADLIAQLDEYMIFPHKADYPKNQAYFEEMHDNLKHDDYDTELIPLINRLYKGISAVFYDYNVDDNDFENNAYPNEELVKLKEIINSPKPFIIEFSSKKESNNFIQICLDFIKENSYKIKVLEDNQKNKKYEKQYIESKGLSVKERNLLLTYEISGNLLSELFGNQEIILLDEGLFNRLTWIKRFIDKGKITIGEFINYLNYYMFQTKSLINYVVIPYNNDLTKINTEFEHETSLYCCKQLLKGNNILSSDDTNNLYLILINFLPLMNKDNIEQLKYMLEKKDQNV